MEAYTDFAGVYDIFMDETPYAEWCAFLDAALKRYRIKDDTADEMLLQEQNTVLDLGCGTGTLTELLALKGYDMIDSLNYLLTEEELLETFRLVENYLYPGGVFLFDFNTVYKYEVVIGDVTIAENREECSFIWENYYHPEEEINEYDLTVFVKNETREENSFRRFQETHYQRGYRLEQIQPLLEQAGLTLMEVLDADTREKVTPESERIVVIGRKNGRAE